MGLWDRAGGLRVEGFVEEAQRVRGCWVEGGSVGLILG